MSGILGILVGAGNARLLGTLVVTVGNDGTNFGYNRNTDLGSSIGNATGDTFTDASGNSRVIRAAFDANAVGANGNLRFALDAGSVPDTDATFKYLLIGTSVYRRVDRVAYSADTGVDNDTSWRWANESVNEFGAGGTINVLIFG